jgi:hypothetical protein
MTCGRISLDESKATSDGHPPEAAWYAECRDHDFQGRGRDRRDEALNDLLSHQSQFARHSVLQS